MHNGKYQCHTAASCTYQLSSPRCSTRAIQKSLTLNKKYLRFFWKKSQEHGPLAEEEKKEETIKTERPRGSSSSNWILMSWQPHRVTSGQSNSGHKQIHISKLFSYIYISTIYQVSLQNQSLCKHKTYIHKHQTQIFKELVPSILLLLKGHVRLGHAGIVNHSI